MASNVPIYAEPLPAQWQYFGSSALKYTDIGQQMLKLLIEINPLKTKRRLLHLKAQVVPRSKHFISVIKNNQFML